MTDSPNAHTPSAEKAQQRETVAAAIHSKWTGACPWYAESTNIREWFLSVADVAITAMSHEHQWTPRFVPGVGTDHICRCGVASSPAGGGLS